MTRRGGILRVALLVALAVTAGPASAHGGVSVERDMCLLSIGPYRMHFTGYQPLEQGSREFCEDIPAAGRTIIVLDYIERALRPMTVEVRIVRNVNLTGEPENDGASVFHSPPKNYPGGTIKIEHEFARPGYFVGIVIATDESGNRYVSRFPFGVAQGGWLGGWGMWLIALAALAVLAALAGLWWRQSRPDGGDRADSAPGTGPGAGGRERQNVWGV